MNVTNLEDGVYTAVLTPMDADFRCNHEALAKHCFSLIERGCKGVALFGTTGEGPSFSNDERIEILQKLITAGFDPKKILVANGSSSLVDTVKLGREAINQGIKTLLIVPPSFYKNISDEGVIAFYRQVIQNIGSTDVRVLLYHIPQYSGVPISLKVIETLRNEFPKTVIGIKESEGNLPFTRTLLQTFAGFKVFVANERQIQEGVALGGVGAICGIANLYPELICSLYRQGKERPSSNPRELDAIFGALGGIPFIPAAKAVMESREGSLWQTLRPPLIPLSSEQKERFLAALKGI